MNVHLIPIFEDNYVFVLQPANSRAVAVVDPGSAAEVLAYLKEHNLTLAEIWITHHHSDHIGGVSELLEKTKATVQGSAKDQHRLPFLTNHWREGDHFLFAGKRVEILSLDGHTRGHIGFHLPEERVFFCGDTLFVMGCGRLFEGSAEEMQSSLAKIASLPLETKLFCTHEYTQTNAKFALTVEPDNISLQERYRKVLEFRTQNLPTVPTTVREELATNPFLRWDSSVIQKNTGSVGKKLSEIFAATRATKDHFDKSN